MTPKNGRPKINLPLVGTQFLTGAQDECEEGSRFVESVFKWKPAVLWVN